MAHRVMTCDLQAGLRGPHMTQILFCRSYKVTTQHAPRMVRCMGCRGGACDYELAMGYHAMFKRRPEPCFYPNQVGLLTAQEAN